MTRFVRRIPTIAVIGLSMACEVATRIPDRDFVIEAVAPLTTESATVMTATPTAPVVRVSSADGRPIAGVVVAFAPTLGAGSVRRTDTTDAQGLASPGTWVLGGRAGPQELRAFLSATTNGEFATFSATAVAGAASTMAVSPAYTPLQLGDSVQIALSFRDVHQNVATAPTPPVYTSSDTLVARVSASGRVRAVGMGSSLVTITSGTLVGTVSIGVGSGVPTITVDTFPGRVASGFAINSAGIAYVSAPSYGWVMRYDVNIQAVTDSVFVGLATADIAFNPAGTVAYFGAHPNTIQVVDVATNTTLRTVTAPDFPMRLLVSPDGAFLYATLESGALMRMNTTTDAFTLLPMGAAPNGIALDSANGKLYVSAVAGNITSFNIPAFTLSANSFSTGQPQGLALSALRDRLFVAREADSVAVFNTSTMTRTATAPAPFAYSLLTTRDGRYLVAASKVTGTVRILDANSLILYAMYTMSDVRRLALDPTTGDIWISFDTDRMVRLRFQ